MKFNYSYFLFAVFLFSVLSINSQKLWKELKSIDEVSNNKKLYKKEHFPKEYVLVSLDLDLFKNSYGLKAKTTNQIIELPDANGNLKRFSIKETSNFEVGLQQKFPEITSFSAKGIDDETAFAKISLGTDGFHALIFSGTQETVYIDPYTKDNKLYLVYKRSSLSAEEKDFKCLVEETSTKTTFSPLQFLKNPNDGKLRTYRLALVCSGEYADFHLGPNQQNIPSTATDQEKKNGSFICNEHINYKS